MTHPKTAMATCGLCATQGVCAVENSKRVVMTGLETNLCYTQKLSIRQKHHCTLERKGWVEFGN